MPQHLLLRLSSPLIAFGGEVIDNLGVIKEFPALSMVTGLVANALGWDRSDDALHNKLQARLRIGSRLERDGVRVRDFQTAQLGGADRGWTTRGTPEERRGGVAAYESPHLRYRDYQADLTALVVLRLEPKEESPTLADIAKAIDRPQRPLFIGRKPCLPTERLVAGWIEAANVLAALQAAPFRYAVDRVRAQWPEGEGSLPGDRGLDVCDERNWTSGLHGGWRSVREAAIRFSEEGA